MLARGENGLLGTTRRAGQWGGNDRLRAVLIRRHGKWHTQGFEKQIASNLFENAIHTSQAKQPVLFVVWGLVWVFFFLLTQFYSKTKTFEGRNCCFSSLSERARSESSSSPGGGCSDLAENHIQWKKKSLEFSSGFFF